MNKTVKWVLVGLAAAFVLSIVITSCNHIGSSDTTTTTTTATSASSAPSTSDTGASVSANGAGNVRTIVTTKKGRAAEFETLADGVVKVREAGGDAKFIVVVNVDAPKDPEKLDLSWKLKSAKDFAESAEKEAYAAEQGWRHTATVWGARSSLTIGERETAKEKRALANQAKAEYQRVLREENGE